MPFFRVIQNEKSITNASYYTILLRLARANERSTCVVFHLHLLLFQFVAEFPHSTSIVDGHKISSPPGSYSEFARTGLLFGFLNNVCGCCPGNLGGRVEVADRRAISNFYFLHSGPGPSAYGQGRLAHNTDSLRTNNSTRRRRTTNTVSLAQLFRILFHFARDG